MFHLFLVYMLLPTVCLLCCFYSVYNTICEIFFICLWWKCWKKINAVAEFVPIAFSDLVLKKSININWGTEGEFLEFERHFYSIFKIQRRIIKYLLIYKIYRKNVNKTSFSFYEYEKILSLVSTTTI